MRRFYSSFRYRAQSRHRARRVVAKVEWHPGELYPRVGFLAYNLANFPRTLALPGEIARWSLTTLREKVIKIGPKIIAHGRYLVFRMAEVAVPQVLFGRILNRIARLRPPDPSPC